MLLNAKPSAIAVFPTPGSPTSLENLAWEDLGSKGATFEIAPHPVAVSSESACCTQAIMENRISSHSLAKLCV